MFSTDPSVTSPSLHSAYQFLETASLNNSLAQNEITKRLTLLPRWLTALYEQQFVQLSGATLFQEMYTPLTARVSLDAKDEPFDVSGPLCEFLDLPKGLLSGLGGEVFSKREGRSTTESSFRLENYSSKRCLLLLGDAGNGKSETLKRVGLLAWQQVMRSLLLSDNSSQLSHKLSLPLWVNLNQVASLGGVSSSIDPNNNNTQPLGLIERQIKQCLYLAGESKETFRAYLKSQSQGQLCWRLLLDGYDEMVTRVNLYRDNRWYESRYEGIKVLISCRTQSIVGQGTYRDWFTPSDGQRVQPGLLSELVLQPFGELQKRLTIEHYCLHQKDLTAPWNNPYIYLEQEKQLPGLSELMANPFMLTMVLKVLPELEHRWRERMTLHQVPFEGIGKDIHEREEKQEIDSDYSTSTSEDFSFSKKQKSELCTPIGSSNSGRANLKTTQSIKLNLYDLLDSYVTYHAERDGQKWAWLYGEAGLRGVRIELSDYLSNHLSNHVSNHLSGHLTLEKRYGLALRAYAEQLAAQLFGQTAESRHQPGLNQLRYYPQDFHSPWRTFFDTKHYPTWQQSGCLLQVSEGRDEQGRDYRELRFRHKRLLEYFALEYVRHYSDRYYLPEGMKGGEVTERSVSSEEKSPVQSTLMETERINRVWSYVWLPQALYHHPLNQRLLTEERDFLDLLVYVMKAGGMNEGWLPEESFWSLIEASRYREDISILSSNAATVLNRTEKSFSRKVLSNTKLPGADLQQGMFHDTDFRESDVRGVRLIDSELTKANLQRARVEGLLLGQLPGMSLGDSLRHFAMDPTGQWLASCDYRTVRLWSVGRRECEAVLEGHTDSVKSVVFSPDGTWLASSSRDTTVRLWSVARRECKAVLEGHTSAVTSVVFSPDGAWLASSSEDKTVRLWSVDRREGEAVLEGHTDWVSSVVFSPDGARLASSSWDTTVRLWSVDRRECEAVLEGHTDWVSSVVFSPDGAWLASSSSDKTVRLWSVDRRECKAVLKGHTWKVTSVVFSPDGAWLTSGSWDTTVRLWSVARCECKAVLEGHAHWVESVVFSLDGQILLSGDTGGVLRRWPVYRPAALRAERRGHTDGVTSVVFSPDGAWLASSSWDKTIRLWSVARREGKAVLEKHTHIVRSVVFSPDGAWLASSSRDTTVRLWSVARRTCEAVLEGHTREVTSVVFSPDGKWLASASHDETVRLWSVLTHECQALLKGHAGSVTSVVFSPDGAWLASGSWDDTVRLWPVGKREYKTVLEGHTREVTSVVFSPDGEWLASGSYDDTVRLWSVARRACETVLDGHTDRVESVVFSPDGTCLASSSRDTTVRLWSVARRECKAVLEGHTNWVNSVIFSPDGAWLASGSWDTTVHLWAPHPQKGWRSPISVWSSHPQFLVSGLDLRGAKDLSLDNRQVFEQQEGKVLLSPLPSHSTEATDVSWDGTMVGLTGLLRREREQNRPEQLKQSIAGCVSHYRQPMALLTTTQAQLVELMHLGVGYQRLLHLLTEEGPVLYRWCPAVSSLSSNTLSSPPILTGTVPKTSTPHPYRSWKVLSLETYRALLFADKTVIRWWGVSREVARQLLSGNEQKHPACGLIERKPIQPFTQVWQSTLLSPIQQSKAQQKTLPNYRWQREHKWQHWSDNELLKQMQLGDYVAIEDSQIVNNIRQNSRQNTHQSSSITSLFKNTPDTIEINDNHHFIRVRLNLDTPHLETAYQRLSNYMASEPFQRARAIDLSHHQLTDTLLMSLLRPLASMTSLKCLQLSHNQITERGLFSLLSHLSHLATPTSLPLRQVLCDHNHISGDHHTLKKIDQRLQQTPLTNLDLSMNFILKGEVQEGQGVHGKPLKFWHRHGDMLNSNNNHHQTGQGTTKDSLSTRYNSVLFASHQQLNSFYMNSVQSIIDPSRQVTPDKGVVGLYAYKGGSGKQSPSSRFLPQWIPNPLSEHAFLVIEGVHGFGQRFLLMADLYANPNKNNKTGFVQLCHCTPEEYYHRTKALSGRQSSVFSKTTGMGKVEFKRLKQLMMQSREHQDFLNFSLKPTENSYNCLKWAVKMLSDAGIIESEQVKSWVPSWEMGNRRADWMHGLRAAPVDALRLLYTQSSEKEGSRGLATEANEGYQSYWTALEVPRTFERVSSYQPVLPNTSSEPVFPMHSLSRSDIEKIVTDALNTDVSLLNKVLLDMKRENTVELLIDVMGNHNLANQLQGLTRGSSELLSFTVKHCVPLFASTTTENLMSYAINYGITDIVLSIVSQLMVNRQQIISKEKYGLSTVIKLNRPSTEPTYIHGPKEIILELYIRLTTLLKAEEEIQVSQLDTISSLHISRKGRDYSEHMSYFFNHFAQLKQACDNQSKQIKAAIVLKKQKELQIQEMISRLPKESQEEVMQILKNKIDLNLSK